MVHGATSTTTTTMARVRNNNNSQQQQQQQQRSLTRKHHPSSGTIFNLNAAVTKKSCCFSCCLQRKLSILLMFLSSMLVAFHTTLKSHQVILSNSNNDNEFTTAIIISNITVRAKAAAMDSPTTITTNQAAAIFQNRSDCAAFHLEDAVEKSCLMSYLATFPGSGSELCLELIEGLTGIKTGHAYPFIIIDSNNSKRESQKVVALKTHYPNKIVRGGHPAHNPVRVSRALLLIRNPMHALPSFFNFISEQESQKRRHTQQAPLEEWIAWRNGNFSSKLYLWRFHMDFWLSQHHLLPKSSSPIVISKYDNDIKQKKKGNKTMILVRYEQLIDPSTGPALLQEMGNFLRQNDNVTTMESANVPCLWEYIVVHRRAKKRSASNRYVPPYLNEQLTEIIQMLRIQRQRYQTQYPQLNAVFQEYQASVEERLRQQQQQQPQEPRRARKKKKKESSV